MLEQMKKVEDELDHQDNEVDRLNEIVREAMNQIYHADKHDKIDQALGNVLNSYPEREKLQILFLRESAGVY
jgi:predicted metallo-beta-lactamase superfamily hydrolase